MHSTTAANRMQQQQHQQRQPQRAPAAVATAPCHASRRRSRSSSCSVQVVAASAAAKPVVMINSCTGKMGQAVAEAALRAGLSLAPYSLCSDKEAAERGAVEVSGQQLQLVGPSTRDAVVEKVGVGSCGVCVGAAALPVHVRVRVRAGLCQQLCRLWRTQHGTSQRNKPPSTPHVFAPLNHTRPCACCRTRSRSSSSTPG